MEVSNESLPHDRTVRQCLYARCGIPEYWTSPSPKGAWMSTATRLEMDTRASPTMQPATMITAENMRGAPDLVVDILSPATAERDRGEKPALYGKHRVTEYWLVDPIAETVSIHRQRPDVLAATPTFAREQTLRFPLLAGFELRLDNVFSSR